MIISKLFAGIAVLILGRQLFWLFVAVVGFALGMNIAAQVFQPASEWVVLAVGLVAGFVGAVCAYFLQQVAIAIAGFVSGGYVGAACVTMLLSPTAQAMWVAWLVGGVIGAVLLVVLFDWALIVLSSLVGASLIVEAIQASAGMAPLLFVGLVTAGIIVQASWMRSGRNGSNER